MKEFEEERLRLVEDLNEVLSMACFIVARTLPFDVDSYRSLHARSQSAEAIKNDPVDVVNDPQGLIAADVVVGRVRDGVFSRIVNTVTDAIQRSPDPEAVDNLKNADFVEFAKRIVKCAAIEGTESSVDFLFRCIAGEPIPYTERSVLGLQQDEKRIDVMPGVRLEFLSGSDDLLQTVPLEVLRRTFRHDALSKLTNATILSVDRANRPFSLNKHLEERAIHVDKLIDALSLACDSAVTIDQHWVSSDKKLAFLENWSSHWSPWRHGSRPPAMLRSDHRDLVVKLYQGLCRHRGSEQQVSVERWLRSKYPRQAPNSFIDSCIDLRVALESVFDTTDDRKNIASRVAHRGAWYLAQSSHKRSEVFKILRKAYSLGSDAVHRGRPPQKGSFSEHEKTLKCAQQICRKAIMKRLVVDKPPDWTALVLGKIA